MFSTARTRRASHLFGSLLPTTRRFLNLHRIICPLLSAPESPITHVQCHQATEILVLCHNSSFAIRIYHLSESICIFIVIICAFYRKIGLPAACLWMLYDGLRGSGISCSSGLHRPGLSYHLSKFDLLCVAENFP